MPTRCTSRCSEPRGQPLLRRGGRSRHPGGRTAGRRQPVDLIYELADSLQLTIKESRVAPKLCGEATRPVSLAGLTVPMKARIVSSQTGKSNAMILVRMEGNLVVFVEATRVKVADQAKLKVGVLLLNLAKMGKVVNFLEGAQPTDGKVVERMLKKAVVCKFERFGAGAWQKAAQN